MSDELFPLADMEKPSPRLKWLKANNLALGELPDGTRFCVGADGIGFADTHLDAEHKYCESCRSDVEHYSVSEFKSSTTPNPAQNITSTPTSTIEEW